MLSRLGSQRQIGTDWSLRRLRRQRCTNVANLHEVELNYADSAVPSGVLLQKSTTKACLHLVLINKTHCLRRDRWAELIPASKTDSFKILNGITSFSMCPPAAVLLPGVTVGSDSAAASCQSHAPWSDTITCNIHIICVCGCLTPGIDSVWTSQWRWVSLFHTQHACIV